jgi:FkbM family methyltransferase
MSDASNAIEVYLTYLNDICPDIDPGIVSCIMACLENTQWDDPQSVDDFNHIAVIALIEAEGCDELSLRELYLQTAIEALESSLAIEKNSLALFHYSIVLSMLGDRQRSLNLAWARWLELTAHKAEVSKAIKIFYFPPDSHRHSGYRAEVYDQVLATSNGYQQALQLLAEALCCSSLVFYNGTGIRWLKLASQVRPDSVQLNLKLGVAMCTAQLWEGIYYLNHSQQLAPNNLQVMHALFLACRGIGNFEAAQYWHRLAAGSSVESELLPHWTQLASDSPFTYVPFDGGLTLAVEANFKSLVTSVLVAEGDWFEDEMEFWRHWIKPGMTVIDVGANVGVYTFSAAIQVGASGGVLAIEPFSGCVDCLKESKRINQLGWVTICHGAASDHQGTARLSLNSASELNELVMDDQATGNFEAVACFTLDQLFEQEALKKVDIIKIDAEGHELAVLAGSERILSKFSPVILYENIAGSHGSNQAVTEYLVSIGYQLFCYRPYVRDLIPVNSIKNIGGSLNIIAMRK